MARMWLMGGWRLSAECGRCHLGRWTKGCKAASHCAELRHGWAQSRSHRLVWTKRSALPLVFGV